MRWVLASLPLLLVVTSILSADEPPSPTRLAIIDVTLIDGSSPTPREHQTVLIEGGKITAILDGKSELPAGTEKVTGTGKFLIPGLWDMHTHIAHPDYLPLFIANGVTGVRELHSFFPDALLTQRNSIREGKLLGPELKVAYTIVDGPNPVWPNSLVAKDAAEGRAAVRKLKEKGADFVKVYTQLSPEAFRAIAAEAKAVGLPMVGHVPESVNAAEAATAGLVTMEHLYGIALATSTEEKSLRDEIVSVLTATDRSGMYRAFRTTQAKAIATHDNGKKQALFRLFKDRGICHTPTLTVLRAQASLDDPKFLADERTKYMPAYLLASAWNTTTGRGAGMARAAASFRQLNEFHWRMVKEMHQEGVTILAGTDCTNPFCFPGFSLHDELELLVQCGLSPHEALKTATSNATRSLGLEKEAGMIAVGQRADLVLLDANPLDDIRNTKKIAEVVVKGKRFDRAALDEMLKKVEANHSPKK